VNGDNKLDLLATNVDGVSVMHGDGHGGFGPPSVYGPAAAYALTTGDYNGDGKVDLRVVANGQPRVVSILLGNGDGTFQGDIDTPLELGTDVQAQGDFNGDGMVDLVADAFSSATQTLWLQTTVTLSPTALSFPATLLGTQSGGQDVTLTNIGTRTLHIMSIAITGTDAREFHGSSRCGENVPPGGICVISVTFSPKRQGLRTADLAITDDTSEIPSLVPLTGSGTALMVSPTSLDFGDQPIGTTSAPQFVTLTNIGKGVARIAFNFIGTNRRDFAETGCPGALGPGQSCTLSVTFSPRVRGNRSAILRVEGGGPPQGVTLTGKGI